MMWPKRRIDSFLNGITMYCLLLYGLAVLAAVAIALSFLGVLSLPGPRLVESLVILAAVSYMVNRLLGRLYQVPVNHESALITALILFCIMPPPRDSLQAVTLGLVAIIAMASKYVLALYRRHVFNPAAIAAVIIGYVGLTHATWWIGGQAMLPFTLLFGLLITWKLRKFSMVGTFVVVCLVVLGLVGTAQHQSLGSFLWLMVASGPLVFLGTVMLTEPSTNPSTYRWQLVYAVVVAVIFASQAHVGPVYATPELALVVGNLYAYAVSSKRRLRLKLVTKTELAPNIYDFAFAPDARLSFRPGQYLEWTLPMKRIDSRGNRRTFTIASSPTEPELHLGVKFYEPSSSYKTALMAMEPGDIMYAGQLAGDFVMPNNLQEKLVFIAGGIGITPFRSMVKYLVDHHQRRDVVVFYIARNLAELVYLDELEAAKAVGVRVVKLTEKLTPTLLKRRVPDFAERQFYVSGPNAMVDSYQTMLHHAGVHRRRIFTDDFSGY